MAGAETSLQAISNLFDLADKDHNGNLSRSEIASIMQQIKRGIYPSEDEINMCMALIDKDSDGVVTKEEFTSAMAKWLGLDKHSGSGGDKKPDIGSPSAHSRKRAVSDLAKFFKQFDTVGDFSKQQELILQRERPEIDHSALLHEFPSLTKEQKLEFHRGVAAIVSAGKTCLLAELYSNDWNLVLRATKKVREILLMVEVFHDPDERFELSSLLIQIFTGVTEVDDPPTVITSDGQSATSVIRRMCKLLSPSVPDAVKQAIFANCLDAIHSYIIGPIGQSTGIPQGGSVWNPDLKLAKQVVEHEQLPSTLLKILDDNFTVSESNQELLRGVLRCVCAFAEHHTNCLEGMLRLGFRPKVVALLQQPSIHAPLLKCGLATLAVLCGHSHSAYAIVPAAMTLTTKELFDILYTQHLILTTLMQSDLAKVDPSIFINVFTVLRYMLPLCSPNDSLFQAILAQLLHFLSCPLDLNLELVRHTVVTLNVCLEEILLVSPLVNRQIWMSAGFSEAMLGQLLQSSSRTDGSFSQLACSCLSVVNTLLTERLFVEVLLKPSNMEFIRRSASLVASPDVSWYAMKFLSGCLKHKELLPAVISSGTIDRLFLSLLKFKTHSSAVASLLGSHAAPMFNIHGALSIVSVLTNFLKADVIERAALFTADHVDNISQLHGVICTALTDGQLGLSDELLELTKAMSALLEQISAAHMAANASCSAYVVGMVNPLLASWNDKLNAAFGKHSYVAVPVGDMDVDGTGVNNIFLGMQVAPTDVMIDVVLIPSWAATSSERVQIPATATLEILENGLAHRLGTNVSLFKDQKMLNGQHIPISDQGVLQAMFKSFVDNGRQRPVVICVMPVVDKSFTNAQLAIQKGALYSAVGLKPKEVTIRELRNEIHAEGHAVNATLMSLFYDYFIAQNVAEVTIDQFIECMTSPKLNFSATSARSIFNAFDTDKNNLLSLKELGVGFAKMADGDVDQKLLLMFEAYDTDRNHFLDVNELTHLIHVASGVSLAEANTYATAVISSVDKDSNAKLDFMEFRDAAYRNLIPVAMLWSEGDLDFIAGGGHHNRYREYNNAHKRRGDNTGGSGGGGGGSSPRNNRQRSNSFSGPSSPRHNNNQGRGGWNNQGRGRNNFKQDNTGGYQGGGRGRGGNNSPRHGNGRSQSFSHNNRPPPLHIKPAKVRAVSPSRGGGNKNPFGR